MLYARDNRALTGSRGGRRFRPSKSNENPFVEGSDSSLGLIIPANSSKYARAAVPSIPNSDSRFSALSARSAIAFITPSDDFLAEPQK